MSDPLVEMTKLGTVTGSANCRHRKHGACGKCFWGVVWEYRKLCDVTARLKLELESARKFIPGRES